MTSMPISNPSPRLKATVALACLQGKNSPAGLAIKYGIKETQVLAWKDELITRAAEAFLPRDELWPVYLDLTSTLQSPGSISLQNRLLQALPNEVKQRLASKLEHIPLKLGQILSGPGDIMRHVYFPIDSIVSLIYVMEDGSSAEISVVGNEGILGISLFMGGNSTISQAVVQSAGSSYRLLSQHLKDEFAHPDGALRLLMLRYTQALITQMSQTAVCNRHHSIHQQLCRWILLSLDRLPDNQLTMTQELIANMLGVRREGVTEAAGKLQKLGVIEYHRGKITVLDRAGLERLSCECYAVVKKETDRLLPYVH